MRSKCQFKAARGKGTLENGVRKWHEGVQLTQDWGGELGDLFPRPSPPKCLPVRAPKAPVLQPSSLAICSAHGPHWSAGAFIYNHLGRVEQTYVAKGRLFLFIKFMASPRLHTVKTERIGPKVSYRMTASDVRTSVNSVGAVEGNKVHYNSKACYPATRCEHQALRKDIQACTWRGRR